MKKKKLLVVLSILVITLIQLSCKHEDPYNTPNYDNYGDKTKELIRLVENNPNIKTLLIKSIAQAKIVNPDQNTNPAQTLDEYYQFVTWAETCMPWSILQKTPYSSLYDKIDQSLNYFYFINDQPLMELDGQGLYNNSLQYVKPYSDWLVRFNKAWGLYLDKPESWNDNFYQLAFTDAQFGLSAGWYEDPSHWKSFNQFFSRHLISPDKRPVAFPNDCTIIASPADAVPQGQWQIDANSNIVQAKGVPIKSGTLTSIVKLIGEDSHYKNEFANGIMTHTFLNVQDYHRFHFPVSGLIKEIRNIAEQDAAGGLITWDAAIQRYMFDPTVPGWQSIETRGCVILDTKDFGLVAILPIGMSQICSVKFEDNIHVGTTVNKGDMLGCFLFGGSDIVMLFQQKAGFVLEPRNGLNNDQTYKHILMGEKYGILKGIN